MQNSQTLESVGTDIDLDVCMEEGYTVIEFDRAALFPDGKTLDKECYVKAIFPTPEYILKELNITKDKHIHKNISVNWSEVYEIYTDKKKGIDSFCGNSLSTNNPNEYDLVYLISTVNSYCGIE
jgi:hypothetical protein|tara:strand:- start:331 stop:702 length:372 start_codon:yes stop_codon:yes gene_type:complete